MYSYSIQCNLMQKKINQNTQKAKLGPDIQKSQVRRFCSWNQIEEILYSCAAFTESDIQGGVDMGAFIIIILRVVWVWGTCWTNEEVSSSTVQQTGNQGNTGYLCFEIRWTFRVSFGDTKKLYFLRREPLQYYVRDFFVSGEGEVPRGNPQYPCLLLTKKFNITTILIAAPHFNLTTSKTQTLPTNSSLWSTSLNPALHRYTSLVRRNFLRFGKRSDGTFPPLASSGERERGEDEMEEGELLPPFEEEQQEPHLVVEGPVKRARNFIRFGRAPARPPALALGEEIKVGFKQFQEKRSLLQGVRERRAGGTRRRMSNFLR